MARMKDLAEALTDAYYRGIAPEVIALELDCPVATVNDWYDQCEADVEADINTTACDDSDDAYALASSGFGTDEDYGGYEYD